MSLTPRPAHLLLPAAIVAAALLAREAPAPRPLAPGPPVVAAVNIQRLFEGLDQRAEAKARIEEMESALRTEQQERQTSIQALQEQMDAAVSATKRADLTDQISLERLRLQFWLQEANGELELEKALQLQHLYRNIKKAVEELAEAEGYDLVIVDDSIEEPSYERDARALPQVQVLQQITGHKVLYLRSTLDITEDLIVRMNNAHRVGP